MLSSADIVRVDLLDATIQNRPTTHNVVDDLSAAFELFIPDSSPTEGDEHVTARISVLITTRMKEDLRDESPDNGEASAEGELEFRWKGEFKYGFMVLREKYEALHEGAEGSVAVAVWPFIRSELMAFMKQSIDAPPLPFQITFDQSATE